MRSKQLDIKREENNMVASIKRFFEHQFGSRLFSAGAFFGILFPIIADQFFLHLMNVLTTAMISSSSQESVSAVSLCGSLSWFFQTLFLCVGSGCAIVVAQFKGRRDEERTRKTAGQALLIAFTISASVMAIICIFAPLMVDTIYASAELIIREKIKEYLVGQSLTFITYALYHASFCVLSGMGYSKTCFRLTVIINFSNFAFSFIFLNLLHLDILGSIIAIAIARVLGATVAVIELFKKNGHLGITMSDVIKPDGKLIKLIIQMGVPFASENVLASVGGIISQMYLVSLGSIAIAANAITNSLLNVFIAAGGAVASMTVTIVGQCVGAGDIELAKRYARRLVWLGTGASVLSVSVLLPLSPYLLMLYSPQPETVPFIYPLLFIICGFQIVFWAGSAVMPYALRAAGDVNYTTVVSMICMWIRIGLGYLLAIPAGLGLNGVWIAFGTEWAIRAVIFRIRFKGSKWYSNKLGI